MKRRLAPDRSLSPTLYDVGDSWLHRIRLEKRLPMLQPQRYAVCIAGENACPPEDVGGIPGYYQFLEVISNPNHEVHEGMLEWWGAPSTPSPSTSTPRTDI